MLTKVKNPKNPEESMLADSKQIAEFGFELWVEKSAVVEDKPIVADGEIKPTQVRRAPPSAAK